MKTRTPLLDQLLAKSGGQSLRSHTLAVVSVLRGLLHRLPLDDRFRQLPEALLLSALLHDAGKAHPAFQARLRGSKRKWPHRHEVLSLGFLQELMEQQDPLFGPVVLSVGLSHRDLDEINQLYGVLTGERTRQKSISHLLEDLPPSLVEDLGRELRQLGSELAADLLGAAPGGGRKAASVSALEESIAYSLAILSEGMNAKRGPDERVYALLLRGALRYCDHLASAGQTAPDMFPCTCSQVLRERVLGPNGNWNAHQQAVAAVRNDVFLVAPTGSGKTEAALCWTLEQEPISSLIYLLPYRASLNAIQTRLENALDCRVGLLHGKAAEALFQRALEDGVDRQAAERQVRSQMELCRLYQPAVTACTPYHLLRAAFRLSGYDVSWTVLYGCRLVLDEIHVYEPRRLGMILGLLSELQSHWKVRLLVMTATLPTFMQDFLVRRFGLTRVLGQMPLARPRHRLAMLEGTLAEPDLRARVVQDFSQGKSVLVCCNTVPAACEVWEALAACCGPENVELLHGRFNARDRQKKEARLEQMVGLDARRRRPIVFVATQVIEVSLNLDFDTIYSEPAPLEALIQRFGRVNRKGRRGTVPVHVLQKEVFPFSPYQQDLLDRSLDVLARYDGAELNDEAAQVALDAIYDPELIARVLGEIRESEQRFLEVCIATMDVLNSDRDLEQEFERMFDATEVLPRVLFRQYLDLSQTSMLEAGGLLVPVSHQQLRRAARKYDPKLRLWVIEADYDEQVGLRLD